MGIVCRALESGCEAAWDAFVRASPHGTFFHLAAWRHVIERAFGHRTHYVLAESGGEIAGILPLAHVKSVLFGNTLVSTPFCVYGGPLARDPESEAALAAYAAGLMRTLGAKAVEFRSREPIGSDWLPRPPLYVTFGKTIEASDEANLKAIPRKQRAMVRKAIQNGLTSVVGRDPDPHYRIYAESVRNLGTPVFSRRYFRTLLDAFPETADIVTVLDDGTPVASVLNFYFRDEVIPYYGGGTLRARERAGNDFMYWEVMRRAAARGARMYDFGRSKIGTGAHAFKTNWGFTPVPLEYRYKLAPGAAIPEQNPTNPKFALMIAGWKRLPLPIANLLGPPIVRGIG